MPFSSRYFITSLSIGVISPLAELSKEEAENLFFRIQKVCFLISLRVLLNLCLGFSESWDSMGVICIRFSSLNRTLDLFPYCFGFAHAVEVGKIFYYSCFSSSLKFLFILHVFYSSISNMFFFNLREFIPCLIRKDDFLYLFIFFLNSGDLIL